MHQPVLFSIISRGFANFKNLKHGWRDEKIQTAKYLFILQMSRGLLANANIGSYTINSIKGKPAALCKRRLFVKFIEERVEDTWTIIPAIMAICSKKETY